MTESILNLTSVLKDSMPEKGIFSQTLFKNETLSLVAMQMAAGEDLSEHTSKFAVAIHVLSGNAIITLPDKKIDAVTGSWIYLAPELPHSVLAESDLSFILYVFKYQITEERHV